MKKSLVLFLFIAHASIQAIAQCMMYPVSLSSRITNASDIVEGKVTAQVSFWDPSQSLIYTANTIDVYKVFKGVNIATQFEVITEGGIVGNHKHTVEPSLTLSLNDIGIFFLEPATITNSPGTLSNNLKFSPYSNAQGFIHYDLISKKGTDVFNTYQDIGTDVYLPITTQLGNPSQTVLAFDIKTAGLNITGFSLIPPTIATITPNPIVAGRLAANILTITGANFGPAYGGTTNLEFPDANNGGAGYISTPANHIVTWTAGSITCWVPSGAGSGFIRITNNLGEVTTTAINLTINYNESNVNSGGIYYQPDLVNDNGIGGFTFVYNNTFNGNLPAVQAFERALQTWRCGTYVNFWRSGTTAIACQANDGTNMVSFDGSCALPAGVLGISYSYYQACGGPLNWYLSENDLKFRTNFTGGINWNYGPVPTGGGQYDFESVCLHELGHSHQLGHTITPVTVMNYAVGPNTDRRTLNAVSELAGGNDIMTRSVISNVCGPTAMISLNGSNCSILAPTANFSGTPLTGCNNINVTFTDLSVGSPTGWTWSFPGGTPNTFIGQVPPPINYPVGTYSVTLTVTNGSGSDAEVKTSYITVNSCPPPVADFTGVPLSLCEGQSVNFTDLSTQGPTSWSWNFGGGGTPNISAAQNPVIAFNTAGVYSVTLTATNPIGPGTITKNAYITVNACPPPPVVTFIASPLSFCAGGSVNFTNQTTGAVNSYQWSFPGGTPATSFAINPVVTYNTPGTYSVTLVALYNGGSVTFTRSNYIVVNLCLAPTVDFSGSPQVICTGSTVQFNDLSTQTPTSWSWTFPSGTPAVSGVKNPLITYNVPGIYNVSLIATNGIGSGAINTKVNYITVANCPLPGSGLIVNDGGFIYAQPGALIQVGVNATAGGFINQDNGANIGTIDNRGQIVITGDWSNNSSGNCFYSPTTLVGEVQFTNGFQLIQGVTPTDFYDLTLLGTGIKQMNVDQNVYGILALNTIELATQQFIMWVRNATTTAITRTPAFNATTLQGFVSSTGNGRLRRNTNSAAAYGFPVGSSLSTQRYRPLILTPSNASPQTLSVRMVNNDPTVDTYDRNLRDPFLGNINPGYYWKVNQNAGTNAVNIREYFDLLNDAAGPIGNILMTEWGFNTPWLWKDLGVVVNSSLGPNLSYIEKSAWLNFNTENFSFAGLSSPLPVELIKFEGQCNGEEINLTWTTATEINCQKFEIQRSDNGSDFITIQSVNCKGNNGTLTNYSFTDRQPVKQRVYYRLKQSDRNGDFSFSKVIVVGCNHTFFLSFYPNPVDEILNVLLDIKSNEKLTIRVYDMLGQIVYTQAGTFSIGYNEIKLNLGFLEPAIYHVVIENGSDRFVEKITKIK